MPESHRLILPGLCAFKISNIFAGYSYFGFGCGAVARYHTNETPFGTLSFWAPDNFVPRKKCDLSTGTVEMFFAMQHCMWVWIWDAQRHPWLLRILHMSHAEKDLCLFRMFGNLNENNRIQDGKPTGNMFQNQWRYIKIIKKTKFRSQTSDQQRREE